MRSVDYDFSNGFFLLSITKISLLFLSLIIYSYLVIRILVKHQKRIKDTYSFSSGKITFTWLKYITIVFILTYFSLIVFFLLDNDNSLGFSSHYIPAIGLTIISFSLTYYILMQPAFSFEDGAGQKENLYTSGLDQNRTITMKKNLISFMENEKPFLEPELSIQQLADKVRIPRHYLSFLINEELHKNFFSFINEYRVEKAKNLLADPQYQDDTVLSVGLNSGFNSKSSFNAIFKQYTSFTPTEYRKKFLKT
jgi:AraC-like DNA-binding protein